MSTATVTSKGQVTVPKDVREALGLAPGTRVTFIRNDDGEIVMSRQPRSVKALRGRLSYTGVAKTLDDMEAGIARGSLGST